MPRRPFPVLALSVGLVIALFAFLAPALGQSGSDSAPQPQSEPPAYPKVRVEPAGGGSADEGRLRMTEITLHTDIGRNIISMSHIRRITFQADPEGTGQDTIQLINKNILRGQITVDQFVLNRESGGEVTWKKPEIREIRVLNEVPLSWSAVLLGLLTLTAMEIILGVDNVIFLAIIAGKLPEDQRPRARKIGLGAALGTRLLLLFSLSFLLGLTAPVFTLPSLGFLQDMEARDVSWRDIILLAGGLFLIAKSTFEIHEKLEHAKREREGEPRGGAGVAVASFAKVIITIAIIDIVFSLDSVITAIGMVEELWVMVVAMVIAMGVMLYFAEPIGRFVDKHPTLKVLALAFLILIGVMLVAEGLGQHMDKGYIYAAMAFSVVVEMVNMQLRKSPKTAEPPPPAPPATGEPGAAATG